MNHHPPGEDTLSEEARREAFRQELRLTPETGGGRVIGRIPKKFMWSALAVFVVLGVGGQLVEHFFGNVGLPTTPGSTTSLARTTSTLPHTTIPPNLLSADEAFIGLKFIGSASVPSFTLTDQHALPFGPAQVKAHVTLITFFNKNCNDICPVLGAELRAMLTDLGPRASRVDIIVVNTDPFSFAASADPQALSQTGLGQRANVHFVTGPVASLNAVWKSFGVQVNVGATANEVAHNSVIYFVSAGAKLSAFATPFARRTTRGQFSLSSADVARFAKGLELETISLIP